MRLDHQVPKGRPNHWKNADLKLAITFDEFQPSLRDLWNNQSEPGSELPGYSQFSLREKETAISASFMDAQYQLLPPANRPDGRRPYLIRLMPCLKPPFY